MMIHIEDEDPQPSYYNTDTGYYDYRRYMIEKRDEFENTPVERPEAGSLGDK